jgi:hypothetical protein
MRWESSGKFSALVSLPSHFKMYDDSKTIFSYQQATKMRLLQLEHGEVHEGEKNEN